MFACVCVRARSQSRMKARQEYLDKVAKSKRTLSRQQDEVAQELVEEIQDTITEEDLAQAQAADDEVRVIVKMSERRSVSHSRL
jgi:excinuclease UvrABC nuclease subunit